MQDRWFWIAIGTSTLGFFFFGSACFYFWKKGCRRSGPTLAIALFLGYSLQVVDTLSRHLPVARNFLELKEKVITWIIVPAAVIAFLLGFVALYQDSRTLRNSPRTQVLTLNWFDIVCLVSLFLLWVLSLFSGDMRMILFLLACLILCVAIEIFVWFRAKKRAAGPS